MFFHQRRSAHQPAWAIQSKTTQRLREFLCHPHFQWAKSSIVIDYTGVGRSFRDVLAMSGVRNTIVPVTITGGAVQTELLGTANVPKQHLIGTLQILLQNRRIRIAPGLDQAGTLKLELENFRRNTANGYQPRNAKIHDDTVLALALASWHATRRYRGLLPPG